MHLPGWSILQSNHPAYRRKGTTKEGDLPFLVIKPWQEFVQCITLKAKLTIPATVLALPKGIVKVKSLKSA